MLKSETLNAKTLKYLNGKTKRFSANSKKTKGKPENKSFNREPRGIHEQIKKHSETDTLNHGLRKNRPMFQGESKIIIMRILNFTGGKNHQNGFRGQVDAAGGMAGGTWSTCGFAAERVYHATGKSRLGHCHWSGRTTATSTCPLITVNHLYSR
jgi:hypothetical protein